MNVSLKWLSAMLGRELDAADVPARLASLGAPVEAVEEINASLHEIVIGVVEEVQQHPNADRLSVCKVNNGSEVLEVVCGAPNVTAGKKYPYAPAGSVLPGGIKLKPRKIRGVLSNGMLCSARELELGEDQDGILELDTDAAAGTRFVDVLGLSDVMFDVEVTPNRPDLLSHKGVARDLGALLGAPVKLEPIPGASGETMTPVRVVDEGEVGGVRVRIDDLEGCPRYMAAVIRGVTIGASPQWLQTRLRSVGQRPINNVVDATNYILQEVGQPLHAFDLDRLKGPAIVVRRVTDGETLATLDGQDRILDSSMTMICDAHAPIAVGGVMGGADSEVSHSTTNIVLECAYFDPKRIRSTRTSLRMSTDASYRFERGTDIQGMADALRRTVALILTTAGGREAGAPVDVYPRPVQMPTVFLRPDRVTHLLGVTVPRDEIERLLTSIGFAAAPKNDRLAVQVPGWRPDVTREEDLIEEIARLRGYDSFEPVLRALRPSNVPDEPLEVVKARGRRIMTSLGLMEARTLPLGPGDGAQAQPVLNPLSAEEGFLRTALLPGLVRAAERNWAASQRDIRLFEIGTVFAKSEDGPRPLEQIAMAGIVTGAHSPAHWADTPKSVDFDRWDVKCFLDEAGAAVGPPGAVEASGDGWEWRDRSGRVRGWAGPLDADRPPWAGSLFGFEVEIVDAPRGTVEFRELPQTPPAQRDLALVVPPGVSAEAIEQVIRQRGGQHLESVEVFDEYRGKEIAGRSVAWRLVFRSPHRTLRDKDVDGAVSKVLKALQEQLGVERRKA